MLCSGMVFVQFRHAFWMRCVKAYFRVYVTCVWEVWVYIYFVALVYIGLPSVCSLCLCLFSVMSVCSFSETGKLLEGRSSID